MTEFLVPMWGLAIIFLVVAFAYSSVGLGGGTSYTAIMAITGISILYIPTISLLLNILVSTLGIYHFSRYKHVNLKLLIPFLISSMPMSFIGGSLHLDKVVFQYVLLVSLVLIAMRIYLLDEVSLNFSLNKRQKLTISIISGGVLGLIAGIVGIGGGIYLVPIILLFNLGTIKEASGCAVVFVFLNSVMGLLGRSNQHHLSEISSYWPLLLAVILGGYLGSFLGSVSLMPKSMEKVLGVIIICAIVIIFNTLFLK